MPECRCHEKKYDIYINDMCISDMTSTLMTSAFLRIDINIDDMCISDMTSTFIIKLVFQLALLYNVDVMWNTLMLSM
jgi:hypothetical protein